jgi:hypothetical protein
VTAIVATLTPAAPVPVVTLNVTIDNPAQVVGWTIYRISAVDARLPVWLGATSSGAYSLVDRTAPLGIPVTYELSVVYAASSTVVSSAPVTITDTVGCFVTNPAGGTTLPVTLVSWPDREQEPRQSALEVLGRPDPVVLSDVHSTPAGQWTFYTATDVDTAALKALLTGSAVAILRTQPGTSIPNTTAAVGKVNERRYSGKGGDQRRFVEVDIQEIAPLPATALPLDATLGGLAVYNGISTLAQLALLRPTLQQLSEIPTG